MICITRKFEIDMGHRLVKHESKCRNAHGHRYVIELRLSAPELDDVGRVIDFGVVKSVFGTYLDNVYDHGFMAQEGDPLIPAFEAENQKLIVVPFSPSVEHLAKHWFDAARTLLNTSGVTVIGIKVFETPNCSAEYAP
jgi:6-pyruvoyltetrahydropterin/6-carboxytetrahydropterin synthase